MVSWVFGHSFFTLRLPFTCTRWVFVLFDTPLRDFGVFLAHFCLSNVCFDRNQAGPLQESFVIASKSHENLSRRFFFCIIRSNFQHISHIQNRIHKWDTACTISTLCMWENVPNIIHPCFWFGKTDRTVIQLNSNWKLVVYGNVLWMRTNFPNTNKLRRRREREQQEMTATSRVWMLQTPGNPKTHIGTTCRCQKDVLSDESLPNVCRVLPSYTYLYIIPCRLANSDSYRRQSEYACPMFVAFVIYFTWFYGYSYGHS